MNNSRKKILTQIRHSTQPMDQLQDRLSMLPRGILPERASLSQQKLVDLFIDQARFALANVAIIDELSSAPQAIIDILKQRKLDLSIRASTNLSLDWESYPELTVKYGVACDSDKVSVTSCLCGVAETGTLVFLSSHDSPTTLNFLPEIHIVLLSQKNIVAYYEDAWDLVRNHKLPRTVNFITGPSRTGDIEQTVQVGIHGPKQLFVLLHN